jgi:hypothetical protein
MILRPSPSHCESNSKRRLSRAKTPQPRRGLDERPSRCGAPLALEYATSQTLFLNVLTIYFFNKPPCPPDLQPKGAHIRPDLPSLDVSPKRRKDDLQRTQPCAQAHTLHVAGPGGLCCGAASRRRTAWHPLDAHWVEQWIMECCPPIGYTGFQPL